MSDRWKALDLEQKEKYEERARQARAEYAEKMNAFREAGGVVAPRAARGSGARRGRGGGPAPRPGGQKRDSTAALEEASDEDFLAEMARRLVMPGFAGLMAQRVCAASDQPGAKRRRAAADGEGRRREASDSPGLGGAPVLPITAEGIAGEAAAVPEEHASMKVGEQEGFERWLAARWEKLEALTDGKSKKKTRALGLRRWAELSDAKRLRWCSEEGQG